MNDWSPESYLRFFDERTRPARDLLSAVPLKSARVVVDLGCGPGNSTELLARAFPGARVSGVDSSPAMLEAARTRLPGCRFDPGDVTDWSPRDCPDGAPDLVFANALFQWVPDHGRVLQRLFAQLSPGSVLAVQMPDNLDEPSHVAMREAAAAMPFAQKFAGALAARDSLESIQRYYDRLAPLATHVDLWHTIYNHVLADPDAIIAWVSATGLRPFLDPLDTSERSLYRADYRARIADAYPLRVDGRVLLRFPRLFIVAVRG